MYIIYGNMFGWLFVYLNIDLGFVFLFEICIYMKLKDKRFRNWNENGKYIYRIVYCIDLEKCFW